MNQRGETFRQCKYLHHQLGHTAISLSYSYTNNPTDTQLRSYRVESKAHLQRHGPLHLKPQLQTFQARLSVVVVQVLVAQKRGFTGF